MQEKKPIPSVEFAKKLLELTESTWVDTEDFDVFIEMAGVQPGKQKVDFCQRLLAIIKRLPEKVVNQEHRQKIIEVGQEYLDQAIEEEDRLEEEEEQKRKFDKK
ncbi:MAG: TyeA family type III secretion system gatekeeper subunit [Verrucomicrobia bacterium]|nr:MAG: TyeA family type III secretion system gatekeeper subunit [Verrucomicrobiota bacterium]